MKEENQKKKLPTPTARNSAFDSVRKIKNGVEQKVDLIAELDKERVQYNKLHGTNYSYSKYKLLKQGLLVS